MRVLSHVQPAVVGSAVQSLLVACKQATHICDARVFAIGIHVTESHEPAAKFPLRMSPLRCAQDVTSGDEKALELVKALTASVVAGAQDQGSLESAANALSYECGILGSYQVFLAASKSGSNRRAGTAGFDQAPLQTVANALQSLASATNGAHWVAARAS